MASIKRTSFKATLRRARSSFGFTLSEVLVTTVIIAGLAAIAIPITLNQQSKAANVSIQSDLTNVSSAIETALLGWRGAPLDGALLICHNDPTYPANASAPVNTCSEGTWKAVKSATGADTTPGLGGRLSGGVSVQGLVASDGSYCIDGKSGRGGTNTYFYRSDQNQVSQGSCKTSGWTASGTGSSSGATTTADNSNLPSAPTQVNATVSSNTVNVVWQATAGTTYAVSVTGQPIKIFTASTTGLASCKFPADTCSSSYSGTLPQGSYTATIRAQGTSGWGPGTVYDFGINTAAATGGTVDMGPQVVNIFGSPELHNLLFGSDNPSASALETYVSTAAGRLDYQRLLFSAPQVIFNSVGAMSAVVASPTALDITLLNPAVSDTYILSSVAMNAVLANSTALNSVANSANAMQAVSASRSAMTILAASTPGMTAVVNSTNGVAMNQITSSAPAVYQVVTNPVALNLIVASQAAVTKVVNSSVAMSTLVNNAAAMQAFAENSTSMIALASSFSAMNVVAASASARAAITGSTIAMNIIDTQVPDAQKSVAIGKLTAGAAGLDPAQYSGLGDIVKSPVAMNAVAASANSLALLQTSAYAISQIREDEVALGKYVAGLAGIDPTQIGGVSALTGRNLDTVIYGKTAVWNFLLDSPKGLTALIGSSASMSTIAASTAMFNDVLARSGAIDQIAGNASARAAVLGTAGTGNTIRSNATYVAKFIAGATGTINPAVITSMTGLLADSARWTAVVSSTAAMNILATSPTARTAVVGAAYDQMIASTMALAKLIANDAGLNPSNYDTLVDLASSGAWNQTILGQPASMNTIVASLPAMRDISKVGSAMGYWAQADAALNSLFAVSTSAEPNALSIVIDEPLSMEQLAAYSLSRSKIAVNTYARDRVRNSQVAIGKLVAGYANLPPTSYADIAALVSSQVAMNTIALSSAALTELTASAQARSSVVQSGVGMAAIAGSSSAMVTWLACTLCVDSMITSSTAMDQMSAFATSRTAIVGDTYALGKVRSQKLSVGKFVAGMASLTPSAYADSDVLAANQSGMTAVAGSVPALDVLKESDGGMASMATTQVSMNALASSATAMNTLRSSVVAMSQIAVNSVGYNAVEASTVALDSVAASSTAMETFSGSVGAMAAFVPSTRAMPRFVASATSMNAIANNAVSRAAVVSNAYAMAQVQSSSMATAKFIIGQTEDLNFMPNPSFESTISGWTGTNVDLTQSGDFRQAGSYALKGSINSSAAPMSADMSARFNTTPGAVITFTAYLYLPAANSADVAFNLQLMPHTGTAFGTTISGTSTVVNRGAWKQLTVTGTMPAGTYTVQPRILAGVTLATGQLLYVDNISITQDVYSSTTGIASVSTAGMLGASRTMSNMVLDSSPARSMLWPSTVAVSDFVDYTGNSGTSGNGLSAMWGTPFGAADYTVTGNTTPMNEAKAVTALKPIVGTAVARRDAKTLVSEFATFLSGKTLNSGARLRINLDTRAVEVQPTLSSGTGLGATALYTGTSADATSRAGSLDENTSWLDLTEVVSAPAGNTAVANFATSTTAFCLAVNYWGRTVYQNYTGSGTGTAVTSCSGKVAASDQSHSSAVALAFPSAPSFSGTVSGKTFNGAVLDVYESGPGYSATFTNGNASAGAAFRWEFSDNSVITTTSATKSYSAPPLSASASTPSGGTARLVSMSSGGERTSASQSFTLAATAFTQTFNTCGWSGYTGPTLAACQSTYGSTYGFNTNTSRFNISQQGIQQWTVPVTGTYRFVVAGARGGNNPSSGTTGGLGATVQGDVSLSAGTVIYMAVGQMGLDHSNSSRGAGGGGATYVSSALNGGTAYFIAGAGGGAGQYTAASGLANHAGCGGSSVGVIGGGGGCSGGAGGSGTWAHGGAGWSGNASQFSSGSPGGSVPPYAYTSGAQGGIRPSSWSDSVDGGFGGGGAAYAGGGGGAGYSGGGGGGWSSAGGGGGGSSWITGTNQSGTSGNNNGHGYVSITRIS